MNNTSFSKKGLSREAEAGDALFGIFCIQKLGQNYHHQDSHSGHSNTRRPEHPMGINGQITNFKFCVALSILPDILWSPLGSQHLKQS